MKIIFANRINMKKNFYVKENERVFIGFFIAVLFHLLVIVALLPFLKNFKKIEDIKPMIINFEGNLSAPPLKKSTVKKIEKQIKRLKKINPIQKNPIKKEIKKTNQIKAADKNKHISAVEKKTVPKQTDKVSEVPINKSQDNETKSNEVENRIVENKNTPEVEVQEKAIEQKSLFNESDFAALDQALQTEQEISEQTVDDKGLDFDKSCISWDSTGEKRRIEYRENPEIPEWVEKEGLKLEVVLLFAVFPNGNVGSIDIVKSSGYSEFDSLIATTFKRWKFNPVQSSALSKGSIAFRTEF